MKTNTATVYVGVDVAKATLQVHQQGRQIELHNVPAGLTQFCKKLKALEGAHVICEATGGYERALVQALHKVKIPVSVVNPAQVRGAAQAQGQRAKTDRIDALMLRSREKIDFGNRSGAKGADPVKNEALKNWRKSFAVWAEQFDCSLEAENFLLSA